MKTVREVAARFLEDVDESVVRPRFERIAKVLSLFVDYLQEKDVTEVALLRIEHVEEFLFVGFRFDEVSGPQTGDVWYSVRWFLKWLRRRKLSNVYEEFAARKAHFRERLKGFSVPGASRGDGGPRVSST